MDQVANNGVENQDNAAANKPFLELYVKASGIDHRRIGACLFCQEFWMELYALYELGLIRVEVKTVNVNSEPFKKSFLGAQPPILVEPAKYAKQITYTDNREIEGRIFHIAKEFQVPLFEKDSVVEKHIESLYRNFKVFLKTKTDDDKQNSNHQNGSPSVNGPLTVSSQQTLNKLIEQLTGIDKVQLFLCLNESINLLEERGTRYLLSSSMTEYDCELMPRLHHIRIAGEQLCHVEVMPRNLIHLWTYMMTAYRTAAFIESCPADQDIIHHYKEQLNLTEKQRVSLQTPTKTLAIPDDVLDEIKRRGYDKIRND
uniref:Chloride intracellular channel exc-4 n=1 Tax=Romanomermis culicivorax TaxID=13658 RepID=A0A915HML2_ROMCU